MWTSVRRLWIGYSASLRGPDRQPSKKMVVGVNRPSVKPSLPPPDTSQAATSALELRPEAGRSVPKRSRTNGGTSGSEEGPCRERLDAARPLRHRAYRRITDSSK